eukprot:scaffold14388_cov186-Alexandrium_tamarense.AAC.1
MNLASSHQLLTRAYLFQPHHPSNNAIYQWQLMIDSLTLIACSTMKQHPSPHSPSLQHTLNSSSCDALHHTPTLPIFVAVAMFIPI